MSLTVLGVISRAFRLLGTVAGGATPDADDAAMALIAFNAMKREASRMKAPMEGSIKHHSAASKTLDSSWCLQNRPSQPSFRYFKII